MRVFVECVVCVACVCVACGGLRVSLVCVARVCGWCVVGVHVC